MSIIPQASKTYTGFVPTSMPYCALWLDAADRSTGSMTLSGSTVTLWKDKSGNANNIPFAGGNMGTLNTTGTLGNSLSTITNASDRQSSSKLIGASGAAPQTFIIVGNSDTTTNGISMLHWFSSTDGTGNAFGGSLMLTVTSNAVVFGINQGGGDILAGSIPTSKTKLAIGVYDGTTMSLYESGTLAGSNTVTLNQTDGTILIGPNASTVQIGECIIFNSGLTTSQRQQMEGYLAWKWGLTGNLPNNHPYKNTPLYTRVFEPVDIDGCQLWLDAADESSLTLSGSNVTAWRDKSGNGFNATTSAGTPTYSASTGITFPGTAHMASSVLSSVSTESGFIVLNNTATGYQGVLGCSISGGREIRIQSAAEGNVISVLSRDLVGVLDSTIAFPKNTDTLLSYHCKSAFWFNGTARGTGLSNVNYAVNGAGTTIIGASGTTGGNRFTGIFKEIILYNFVLSATQRQQVEGYLANKWRLRTNLPSTHSFKLYPALTILFSPLQISGCQFWIDASDRSSLTLSGSNVTGWADKTGINTSVTVTGSPTYGTTSRLNNGYAVTFNGTSNSILYSGFTLSQPFTAFAVTVQRGSTPSGYSQVIGSSSGTSAVLLYTNSPTNLTFFAGTAVTLSPSVPYSLNITGVYSTVFNGSSSFLGFNGTGQSSLNPGTLAWNGIYLGRDFNATFTSHDVAEIIFYNSALSVFQRQEVEGYLATKWGLRSNFPATHPFKNITP